MIKAAELFVRCLASEGIDTIFGIPGEENLDMMDALLDSPIKFITTRHEQGAAFMADVYGRLTGKAGVCLATLGPGATNLITGVADANMDRAPVVAIAGQAATTRLHKESHQVLDLVNLFEPVTKYSTQVSEPDIIPEVIRKAFKVAQMEKPGCSFISFPENIASMQLDDTEPLKLNIPPPSVPIREKIEQAAELISSASYPIVIAGNGVIRAGASDQLINFAEKLGMPVATTFMAKGSMPFSNELCMGTVGLQARDYVSCGIERADVVICVGYDIVEYHPHLWNKDKNCKIIHIDSDPAEVDACYPVEVGVIGHIGEALTSVGEMAERHEHIITSTLRKAIVEEMSSYIGNNEYPVKPQKIICDIREALGPEDILISDVGAHKMWIARMYQAEQPNTCIISNGFASMGIATPGAMAAKIAYPNRKVIAATGDAGFMMNMQEIETAIREEIPFVVLIWSDSEYGLIKWKQMNQFGRESNIKFNNPDFVMLAESFGAKGYKVESTDQLLPILKQALEDKVVAIIDCPVDYSENMKLTEKLGELVCPI